MIEPRADRPIRVTLGADKGYDTEDFVNELRTMNVTPHVAAKAKRVRHRRPHMPDTPSVSASAKGLKRRSAGERPSGLPPRPCCAASRASVHSFTLTLAAYNLIRLPKLLAA